LRTLGADALAGVTVGLVVPLAMAFAISSGMTPLAGLYCAVVTGFIVSAIGGSNVQIGGPTGASSWWSLASSPSTASMACSCVP
jgi:SulP family sulfate permease